MNHNNDHTAAKRDVASREQGHHKKNKKGSRVETPLDEEKEIEELMKDNELDSYQTPEFVLRNLKISRDECFKDRTCSLSSRHAMADLAVHQMCFYFFCVLKVFALTPTPSKKPPNVLIFGSGFLGSRLIKQLMIHRCGPILRIFSRGDLAIKYWRKKGIQCSDSLPRLLKDGPADIVFLCSGQSSFSAIMKLLKPYVSPATAVITSSFGLARKRIFTNLGTLTVFRSYTEPETAERRMKEAYDAQHSGGKEIVGFNTVSKEAFYDEKHKNLEVAATKAKMDDESTVASQSTSNLMGNDNVAADPAAEDTLAEDLRSLLTLSLIDDSLNDFEYAADLIVKRTFDICHIIFLIENFYSIHNLSFEEARHEAVSAVLGYFNDEDIPKWLVDDTIISIDGETMVGEGSPEGGGEGGVTSNEAYKSHMNLEEGNEYVGEDGTVKKLAPVRQMLLLTILRSLHKRICIHFHRQFSKSVRVIDLPSVADLKLIPTVHSAALEARKQEAEQKKLEEEARKQKTNNRHHLHMNLLNEHKRGPNSPIENKFLNQLHGPLMHSEDAIIKILEYDKQLPRGNDKIDNLLDELDLQSDDGDDDDTLEFSLTNEFDALMEKIMTSVDSGVDVGDMGEPDLSSPLHNTIKDGRFLLHSVMKNKSLGFSNTSPPISPLRSPLSSTLPTFKPLSNEEVNELEVAGEQVVLSPRPPSSSLHPSQHAIMAQHIAAATKPPSTTQTAINVTRAAMVMDDVPWPAAKGEVMTITTPSRQNTAPASESSLHSFPSILSE